MPAYFPSIVDGEGRLDPEAFRRTFFQSLEQHSLDAASFHFTGAEGWQRSERFRTGVAVGLRPYGQGSGEDSLEELSDVEDEDSESVKQKAPLPSQRRLKLVLDLDNTLLHAQSKHKLSLIEPSLDDFRDADTGRPEMYRFTLPRQNAHAAFFIKFRPGVPDLLYTVAEYCDLAIHTNGTREYADVVMSILDPQRTLFAARVAARDDDSGKNDRKDMTRLFSMERDRLLSELLIIDDRRDVWDSYLDKNIIQCNYYEYFESRREALVKKYDSTSTSSSFASPGDFTGADLIDSYCPENFAASNPAVSSSAEDLLEDHDRQLYFLKNVIVDVAKEWYKNPSDKNVWELLQERRSRILSDCVILMTGYHKVEQASQFGMLDNGPQHRRRLEHMGAKVVENPSVEVTHVLVMRQTLSTDRARSLCGKDTKFVHNLWVYACEQTWTKVDETFFESNALLQKWTRLPLRPLFEHWAHTRQFYDSLKNANAIEGTTSSSSNDDTSDSTAEPGSVSRKRALELDEEDDARPSGSRRRLFSHMPVSLMGDGLMGDGLMGHGDKESAGYTEREWLATGLFSHGCEVWGGSEHVVLKYDPFTSAALLRKTAILSV